MPESWLGGLLVDRFVDLLERGEFLFPLGGLSGIAQSVVEPLRLEE